jgi:hypothetical protein
MNRLRFLLMALLVVGISVAWGATPRTISYQGVLVDNNGVVVADGTYNASFRIYDAASAGNLLWTEAQVVQVTSGRFNVILGSSSSLDPLAFDIPYWLGVQVESDPEMTPRIELTSGAYSLNARTVEDGAITSGKLADNTVVRSINSVLHDDVWIRAGANATITQVGDTLFISSTGPAPDGDWTISGNDMYSVPSGNVGIGTATPDLPLEVAGATMITKSGVSGALNTHSASSSFFIEAFQEDNNLIKKDIGLNPFGGSVGIGTTTPLKTLDITGDLRIDLTDRSGALGKDALYIEISPDNYKAVFLTNGSAFGFWSYSLGQLADVELGDLLVDGTATVDVLQITGGADLAEPFDITGSQTLEPGSVVVIDESETGALKVSTTSYDTRVAGVISGAGGINTGLTLSQRGLVEGGQNVALSGRVYVRATASNGPIHPGDLLTTSSTPGLAMKATDAQRTAGAVLGKAMSTLEEGEGLVLVLVSLQ